MIRGVRKGLGLAAVLVSAARSPPWKLAFSGRDGVIGPEAFVEVPRKRGPPQVMLLSPTRQTLDDLHQVWAKELPKGEVPTQGLPLSTAGSEAVELISTWPSSRDRGTHRRAGEPAVGFDGDDLGSPLSRLIRRAKIDLDPCRAQR